MGKRLTPRQLDKAQMLHAACLRKAEIVVSAIVGDSDLLERVDKLKAEIKYLNGNDAVYDSLRDIEAKAELVELEEVVTALGLRK